MQRTSDPVPVLIVGAGPVGLALANELGYRGVPYLLIDEGQGEVTFPAGEGMFARTLEHIRRWGYSKELRFTPEFPAEQKRNVIFATSFRGKVLARFLGTSNAEEPRVNPHSPEGPLFCPKKAFDPALRRGAERFGVGELHYGTRLVEFSQDATGINAVIEDVRTRARSTVAAQYLAGADGARSVVRRTLGISYVGSFAEGHNFAIYFESQTLADDVVARFGAPITQLQMINLPRRPYLVAVNGRELWRMSMYIEPDETPDAAQCLLEILGPSIPCRVIRAQPWKGNRVVAAKYRDGRVFLVGDAAHLRWPKGGFGANTGIGDAVDLGWKLWATLSGWGGEQLLDSYEAERRPIAVRNVNEASNNRQFDELVRPSPLLDEDSPAGEEARRATTFDLYALRLREFRTAGIQLGYRYRNSPICIADDTLEPPDDHWLYVPSTWPGCRAPHAWLDDSRSTLDLYGPGFVLVRFNPELDAKPLEDAARRRGIPLRCEDIASAKIRELYEFDLVLVRPDGHVAWRASTPPANPDQVLNIVTGAGKP
jgi:2-polyprenyl-6-methoxyphenol hydroxylase-like FAD-dependent oxidoreductase